jgi:acyl-CoA synthetase (AMP-forming)/AMP-acid ligase II
MVIVGGRNVYAEAIEAALSGVSDVSRERVAAFSVEVSGRERLVVLAETESTDTARLRKQIAVSILDRCDVAVEDVRLAEPKSLPKTSSGKISRSRCRALYEQGHFGG